MRGEILIYDAATRHGLISGADGQRYDLSAADLLRPDIPRPGQTVDFVPEGGRAGQIVILAPRPAAMVPTAFDAERLSLWRYFARCCTRKYIDGNGRARRKEYWGFVLFWVLFVLAPLVPAVAFAVMAEAQGESDVLYFFAGVFMILTALVYLALLIPALTVRIRRFHDVGLTGWLVLVAAVPYAGALFVFVVTVLPSQASTNKHGAPPGLPGGQTLAGVFD